MTTTTMIAVRVDRGSCHGHGLLSEVDVRDDDSGIDLRVGLRTVVDGRGRHLVMWKKVCLVSEV